MHVEFFFSVGSRYSYLAAVQLPRIASTTGAAFRWRTLFSPDLIVRAGGNPFDRGQTRGQYRPEYRTLDASRWAAFLRVAYKEPEFDQVDWRNLAAWCAAAEIIGGATAFGTALFQRTFGSGAAPRQDAELSALASSVGLSPADLLARIESGAAGDLLDRNLKDALEAGAFGVPSFVVEDGALFWGQDRMTLLAHHLQNAT